MNIQIVFLNNNHANIEDPIYFLPYQMILESLIDL